MIDSTTLIPLGVAVPTVLWIGRKLVQATSAAKDLTYEIKALRADIHEKVSRRDLTQWIERLGYKNPELDIPEAPRYDEAA